MDKQEIIKYWLNSSNVDFTAMENLFLNKHYVWALFLGHLVIEKLLKASYVKNIDKDVPHIHNLLKIAEISNICLSKAQKDFLLEITTFNIKTRYPDYKNRFYKKVTKEFATKYITKIKEFRLWLLKKIQD